MEEAVEGRCTMTGLGAERVAGLVATRTLVRGMFVSWVLS
jgi:hypothetical protein